MQLNAVMTFDGIRMRGMGWYQISNVYTLLQHPLWSTAIDGNRTVTFEHRQCD